MKSKLFITFIFLGGNAFQFKNNHAFLVYLFYFLSTSKLYDTVFDNFLGSSDDSEIADRLRRKVKITDSGDDSIYVYNTLDKTINRTVPNIVWMTRLPFRGTPGDYYNKLPI